MRKFIKKSLLFFVGLGILNVLVYFSVYLYHNYLFFESDAIFIWGDSQMYEGIDLAELSATLDKKVYSSARYGSGVYDFLCFTEHVSKKSEVIISVGKLVQIRRKKYDYHRTGLSPKGLFTLWQNNYSNRELFTIIKKNLKPSSYIRAKIKLAPHQDIIKADLPLEHFQNYYQQIPSFLKDKQNIYLAGIKNLIEKKCTIIFLEFPYHPQLAEIESESPVLPETEDFKERIASLFAEFKTDTIFIETNKNIFKDFSHLNQAGANFLSKKIGEKMKGEKVTTLYIVRPETR